MQSGWAIGYLIAALLAGTLLGRIGWRGLFLVGVAPALSRCGSAARWRSRRSGSARVTRRCVAADLWRPPLLQRTLSASFLAAALLFAYWGLFTWIPTYLSAPVEKGGAGLSLVRSTAWIVPLQIGAFFGYTAFGWLADRFGRRPVFLAFVLAAAALVPAYGLAGRHADAPSPGTLVGFFGHGYFSVFGALLADVPSSIRHRAGLLLQRRPRHRRAGAVPDRRPRRPPRSPARRLASTAALYVLGGLLIFTLPETRGETLAS
jgi:MFS family permease